MKRGYSENEKHEKCGVERESARELFRTRAKETRTHHSCDYTASTRQKTVQYQAQNTCSLCLAINKVGTGIRYVDS